MKERILALLGLSADTAEPEALAALEKRLKAPDRPSPGLLTALGLGAEASTDEAIAKAYTLVPRADLEAEKAKVAEATAGELVRQGKVAGKITPVMESWAREFARRDPIEFAKCVESMPVQFRTDAKPPATGDPKTSVETDTEEDSARRMSGLSSDEWSAAKARIAARGGR